MNSTQEKSNMEDKSGAENQFICGYISKSPGFARKWDVDVRTGYFIIL
jgi:hypothetical protein